MYFTTPFWLLALLPWLGLAAWMLWGRRRRVRVPFLPMWEGPALEAPPRRGLKLPPAGVILAMLALLLAIAAAGGPMLKRGGLGATKPALFVIVDRGLTMSQPSAVPGKPRYVAAAAELSRLLSADEPASLPIAVIDPLADAQRWTDLGGLTDAVAALPPTALDLHGQTAASVGRALAENSGPAVVLTDRPIDRPPSPSLARVSPPGQWNDIAIIAFSARALPVPQVMLRIANDSALSEIAATVRSESKSVSRTVVLPTRGKEQDYFFDLPLGETVEAEVGESRAYLLREGIAAKFFPSADLPAAVARMVRVYVKERGKGQAVGGAGGLGGAKQDVQVVTSVEAVTGATPAAVAAPVGNLVAGPIVVVDDPVTRGVNWSALGKPIRISADPPEGWRVVLSAGGVGGEGVYALVEVRDQPARQVWVGFDAEGFSATPAFVVFWTNVLDWVAGNGQEYASSILTPDMGAWRRVPMASDPSNLPADAPGIYARGDGSRQAFDAPTLPPPTPPDSDEPAAIHRLAGLIADRPPGRDAGPIAMWLALGCLLAAAVVWKRA